MNRQQRRQANLKTKVPTYNLTRPQLNDLIHEELMSVRQETLNYATSRCLAAFIVSLHDEFDFGRKRLEKLLSRVTETFDCIEAKTVSLDDLVALCDSFGIVITDGKKPYGGKV